MDRLPKMKIRDFQLRRRYIVADECGRFIRDAKPNEIKWLQNEGVRSKELSALCERNLMNLAGVEGDCSPQVESTRAHMESEAGVVRGSGILKEPSCTAFAAGRERENALLTTATTATTTLTKADEGRNPVDEEHIYQRFLAAVPADWRAAVAEELCDPVFRRLALLVAAAYREKGDLVVPPRPLVFRALRETPFERVRVVIIGQDPYVGRGQADGLAFSVGDGAVEPPSLRNIRAEISRSVNGGLEIPVTTRFCQLAANGVLLLNAALTTEIGVPGAHSAYGWTHFATALVAALCKSVISNGHNNRRVCFLLWGASAAQFASVVPFSDRFLILRASHPSPKSANCGFIGCNHFRSCDEWLEKGGEEPVFKRWARGEFALAKTLYLPHFPTRTASAAGASSASGAASASAFSSGGGSGGGSGSGSGSTASAASAASSRHPALF